MSGQIIRLIDFLFRKKYLKIFEQRLRKIQDLFAKYFPHDLMCR